MAAGFRTVLRVVFGSEKSLYLTAMLPISERMLQRMRERIQAGRSAEAIEEWIRAAEGYAARIHVAAEAVAQPEAPSSTTSKIDRALFITQNVNDTLVALGIQLGDVHASDMERAAADIRVLRSSRTVMTRLADARKNVLQRAKAAALDGAVEIARLAVPVGMAFGCVGGAAIGAAAGASVGMEAGEVVGFGAGSVASVTTVFAGLAIAGPFSLFVTVPLTVGGVAASAAVGRAVGGVYGFLGGGYVGGVTGAIAGGVLAGAAGAIVGAVAGGGSYVLGDAVADLLWMTTVDIDVPDRTALEAVAALHATLALGLGGLAIFALHLTSRLQELAAVVARTELDVHDALASARAKVVAADPEHLDELQMALQIDEANAARVLLRCSSAKVSFAKWACIAHIIMKLTMP